MTARVARVRVDASACTSRTFAPESQSQTRAVPSTEHVANATRLPKDFTDEFATSSGCACANARAVPVAISTSHALPADVVTTPHGSVSGLVPMFRAEVCAGAGVEVGGYDGSVQFQLPDFFPPAGVKFVDPYPSPPRATDEEPSPGQRVHDGDRLVVG